MIVSLNFPKKQPAVKQESFVGQPDLKELLSSWNSAKLETYYLSMLRQVTRSKKDRLAILESLENSTQKRPETSKGILTILYQFAGFAKTDEKEMVLAMIDRIEMKLKQAE